MEVDSSSELVSSESISSSIPANGLSINFFEVGRNMGGKVSVDSLTTCGECEYRGSALL